MGRTCLVLFTTTLLAASCGSSNAGKKTSDAACNGGTDAGKDAGKLVWHPPDAGADTGSSTHAGSGGAHAADAGLAGRSCAQVRKPLPAQLLPRCAASTRSCIAGCMQASDPDSCRSACIKADHTPAESQYGVACNTCVFLQLFGCIDQAGCHDGVAEALCCLEDKCPTGSADNCGQDMCGNELRAAATCGYYAKMECLDYLSGPIGQCFQPAEEDAGAGP